MARRKQQAQYVHGTATHRRTEGDYMSVLLESVTLDDWRDVVSSALLAAKNGDTAARAWLAQYLVGKADHKAPTPLTVVVQQFNGADPLVEKLAKPAIDRINYPILHGQNDWEDDIKALVAAELSEKLQSSEPHVTQVNTGDTSNFSTE